MTYSDIIKSGVVPEPPIYPLTTTTTTYNPNLTPTTTTTTYPLAVYNGQISDHSISPASGYFGTSWPNSGAIPQSFSAGGWTLDNRGFKQQTFLGASIRSFNMNGGFGDTSSTLSIELVNDEYNKSDETPQGKGDDVYHNGLHDLFAPPVVGSPVFFKFGQNFATVEEAYRKTFDDLYGMKTMPDGDEFYGAGKYDIDNFSTLLDNTYVDLAHSTQVLDSNGRTIHITAPISGVNLNSPNRGKSHLVFGGILQTYTQNRGPGGNPLYSVQVIDPREILSNTVLILNNYAGTVYNNKNLLNIYGFLEHNVSLDTLTQISGALPVMRVLKKKVDLDKNGTITFEYDDTHRSEQYDKWKEDPLGGMEAYIKLMQSFGITVTSTSLPQFFPITGTGYARRSPQGIPYYRVRHAINALMGNGGALPKEYIDKGFGGTINFRGFNYIVDFGTLPELPGLYYLDFDQINLLDLALEICDVVSQDLFVTLLPVIDHPACAFTYKWNKDKILANEKDKLIAGIIRLDAIDRSKPPTYGAVKSYIDGLAMSGIYVENQDVGFELSNIVTDKFIVGAQEVDMHYFSTNADRDELEILKKKSGIPSDNPPGYEWTLDCSLSQQVLPYYGMLGKHAVTIPKGFGAYQQILLDATSLNANGVGAYYVATEMELRCAMISYDRWKEFLKQYNDTYIESVESNDAEETGALSQSIKPEPDPDVDPPVIDISNNYAVTVPRSVFHTYAAKDYGDDKLPYSPCNPPYGYPLYYKRMTKIGIPEGGLTDIGTRWTTIMTNFAELKATDNSNYKEVLNSQFTRLRYLKETVGLSSFEQKYYDEIERLLNTPNTKLGDITNTVALIENNIENNASTFAILPKIAKKNTENALKVYNFVKSVADECLGRKFLIKIPREVNLWYTSGITCENLRTKEYRSGPFGFKPRPITSGVGDEFSKKFIKEVKGDRENTNMMKAFLSSGTLANPTKYAGSLNVNYNPIAEQYEYNYSPVEYGGFFEFDLYSNTLSSNQITQMRDRQYTMMPIGVQQMLIPQDLTNFINENGRIAPYVRFDHSQHLSLEGLNKEDFTQQVIVDNGMIPDLCDILDNTNGDEFHSFPNFEQNNQNNKDAKKDQDVPEQVAFVKCSISDKFFMPPKSSGFSIQVHGQEYKDIGTKSIPNKIFVPCSGLNSNGELVSGSGVFIDSFRYYQAHYVPKPVPGASVTVTDFNRFYSKFLQSDIINTELQELDTQHVYALITLPGRIIPTKDARFRDSTFQNMNAEKFKHFMTMDTVTGLPGFDTPSFWPKPMTNVFKQFDCEDITPDVRVHAWLAARKALNGLSFALPQQVNATMPSPIYPNLVVLPLMSKERCYGPWVSSQLDTQATLYSNIGGRIEFIKDENLSPWNYSGYQLMHEAGRLQAEFSNSLLLFSERGGFVVPAPPSGSSLGKALLDGGPLVTNIQVDVGDGGIKTTYKLDLYTASFGKLQKQKQEQISKISRERQKLRDERNALIRKGLGKVGQSSRNYGKEYDALKSNGGQAFVDQVGLGMGSAMTNIILGVKPTVVNQWSSELKTAGAAGNNAPIGNHSARQFTHEGSLQSNSLLSQTAQSYLTENDMAASHYLTGGASITNIFSPVSLDTYHPAMAFKQEPFIAAKGELYRNENTQYEESDITRYGAS